MTTPPTSSLPLPATMRDPADGSRRIVHLRGTSGSGKSWLVWQLLNDPMGCWVDDQGPHLTLATSQGKVVTRGYRSGTWRIAVVGPYRTPCGGCDAVPTQDEIGARIHRYAALGDHVVFEGLLASGLQSRYEALARALATLGHRYYALFLDTPLDVCLARIQARRAARGDTRPLNAQNTIAKHGAAQKCLPRLRALGLHAELLPMGQPGLSRLRAVLGLP